VPKSKYALTSWHDAVLERSDDSRFPIVKQTLHSIHFRRPSGVITAHFSSRGTPVAGPGTWWDYLMDGVSDGWHGQGANAVYATARSTYSTGTNIAYIGQRLLAGTYTCYRSFYAFPTGTIEDSATINDVTLTLTCQGDSSDTDFDVEIVKCAWASIYTDTAYDLALSADADSSIWRNTSGMALDTPYTSGSLSGAWIVKTGDTKYALRSSLDTTATPPTGYENIQLYSWNDADVTRRPTLKVDYDAIRRVTQVLVEADILNDTPQVNVTQELVEVDFAGDGQTRKVAQELLEVDIDRSDANRQVAQVLLEADLLRTDLDLRVSQIFMEVDSDDVWFEGDIVFRAPFWGRH
jgi:hypothetical protein